MSKFTDELQTLAQMLASRLTDPVGRVQVTPGTPAWDSCCDGQLSVWVTSAQANSRPNCPPFAVTYTIAVQVIRCIETVRDNGRAPSAQKITEDGLHIVQDMEEIRNAIVCDVDGSPVLGQWQQLEPMGGCSGGQWTFTLMVPL